MASFFLKLARGMVRSAMGTINSQANILQEQVTAPVQGFIKAVTGGIWKGDGADRFAAEMSSEVVPQLANMFNAFDIFGGTINKAMDILDRADREATSKANMLNDVFSKIF